VAGFSFRLGLPAPEGGLRAHARRESAAPRDPSQQGVQLVADGVHTSFRALDADAPVPRAQVHQPLAP
jgi:hypothetical protein